MDGTRCGSCGVEVGATAKFCSECGTPLTQAPRSAEYKQVTVLFADVVRSMDLAAAVGAERLREIMADLVDCASSVVQRYGGTVDKFTGDGIMAVFGAPVALEDHAVRACLAALGIQEEAQAVADGVRQLDGVDLQLRVGLNSGQVIAGEIGSGALGYTAVGEHVGMAQRMESVASPGGVMLSSSTARLVEGMAELGEPELVQIKGADEPVPARRLFGVGQQDRSAARAESNLVGRRWEMSAIEGLLDRAIDGHGSVVGVVGPPGIGKSRLTREVAAMANRRGVDVFATFCESHTTQVPFHVIARLMRSATGVEGVDPTAARALIETGLFGRRSRGRHALRGSARYRRSRDRATAHRSGCTPAAADRPGEFRDAGHHDPCGLRHRRCALDRRVQRIDARRLPHRDSPDALADADHLPARVSRRTGADAWSANPGPRPAERPQRPRRWSSELLGPDPSVGELGRTIAERAAGTPFFAEEIVRDLAERDVLQGDPGAYVSAAEAADANCARHVAGDDRFPHRSARPEGETNAQRGGGCRFAVRQRPADARSDVEPDVVESVGGSVHRSGHVHAHTPSTSSTIP